MVHTQVCGTRTIGQMLHWGGWGRMLGGQSATMGVFLPPPLMGALLEEHMMDRWGQLTFVGVRRSWVCVQRLGVLSNDVKLAHFAVC